MTVCCGAGTLVAELDEALAAVGQCVAIPPSGTVGGALAVGRSGIRRLGYGPVRDTLLQARYVSAARRGRQGRRPDGEERERLRPVPAARRLARHARLRRRRDPAHAAAGPVRAVVRDGRPIRTRRSRRLYRPTSVLWDGTTTWVLLEGHPRRRHRAGARRSALREAAGPPALPTRRTLVDAAVGARRRCAGRSSPRSASASSTTPTRRRRSTVERRRPPSSTAGSSTTSTRPGGSTPASTSCDALTPSRRSVRCGRVGSEALRCSRHSDHEMPLWRNVIEMRGPASRTFGTECCQWCWQAPPITSRSPWPTS